MKGAESSSPMQQDDSQISSEMSISLAEAIEDFQQCVEDILEEIEQDEVFSDMTAEDYDNKKSYLTRHLIELSRLHRLLADQHVHLVNEVSKNCPQTLKLKTPICYDFVFRPSGGDSNSSNSSNRECVESSSSLSLDSSHSNVVDELQKQVDDLKLVISESDFKMKSMEEELEKCRKSLAIAKDTISNLKGEKSSKVYQQNQMMKYELQSGQKLVGMAREQLTAQMGSFQKLEKEVESCMAEITERDDEIKKLNTKNDRLRSEILKMEETLKSKEDTWNRDVINLKVQLKNRSKSFDDLKKQLNTVRLERNRTCGKLETLEEEKCSQDKLIQELETRLSTLQVEHERVVSSFENAEKVNSELTLKVVELGREVDRQREVISVITEEKVEAIRQLSCSLEHYMSRYKHLRRLYAANKTFCFGF